VSDWGWGDRGDTAADLANVGHIRVVASRTSHGNQEDTRPDFTAIVAKRVTGITTPWAERINRMRSTAVKNTFRRGMWAVALFPLALCLGGGLANAAHVTLAAPPTLDSTPLTQDPRLADFAHQVAVANQKMIPGSIPAWGFYESATIGNPVMFAGAAGHIANPAKQLQATLNDYGPLGGLQNAPAGPLGGVAECGNGTLGGDMAQQATVCGWADNGSVGLLVIPSKPIWVGAIGLSNYRSQLEHVN
jgi:hypothetical protein